MGGREEGPIPGSAFGWLYDLAPKAFNILAFLDLKTQHSNLCLRWHMALSSPRLSLSLLSEGHQSNWIRTRLNDLI